MGPGVRPLNGVKSNHRNTLFCFYDMEKSPSSFDIIVFLTLAENYRIYKTKCDSIHLVIVPGSNQGFRSSPNGNDIWDINNKIWRLHHMITNSCWLLPSCKGVSILETRTEAEFIFKMSSFTFPVGYTVLNPFEHHNWNSVFKWMVENNKLDLPLQSSIIAKNKIDKWLKSNTNNKTVTLNLRECSTPARNSNINNWIALSRIIENDGYTPIIVRDAEANFDPLPEAFKNTLIFPEANHIEFRLALYELCDINLFVTNGIASLAWFSKNIKYAMCKLLSNDPELTSNCIEFFTHSGFLVGEQPFFTMPYQKWIWNYDDNLNDLINIYYEMKSISASPPKSFVT